MTGQLENIEITLAHHERQIGELSEIINAQWKEIDRLKRHIAKTEAKLVEYMDSAGEDAALTPGEIAARDKPPHYWRSTMNLVKIYGIKNCDTVKAALRWLDKQGVPYDFHNYKKQGVDIAILQQAIAEHGWEQVINRRGTTWRALPDNVKETMTPETAIKAATENPSLIKRPLMVIGGKTYIGFDEQNYKKLLSN